MKKEMSNAAAERAAAKKALANGSLKEYETYTAKQVATRCGTDAKTMRKFFRSDFSTIEPVGQGGRYEFDATDLPQIKQEFDQWSKRSAARRSTSKAKAKVTPKVKPTVTEVEDDDVPLDRVADAIDRAQEEEIEGPSTEELELLELEDIDLEDLEDL